MENYSEDRNRMNITLLHVILFSLMLLIFSGASKTNSPVISSDSLSHEMASFLIPKHSEAILLTDVSLPEPLVCSLTGMEDTGLHMFSVQYYLNGYDQKTRLDYKKIQQEEVVITPLLLWKLYNPASSGDRDVFPVLS